MEARCLLVKCLNWDGWDAWDPFDKLRTSFLVWNGRGRDRHFMNMEQQYAFTIEPNVYARLEEESREEHRDKSEIVNDLLRRHQFAKSIKHIREKLTPLANAAGYYTDEDIFRDVS